MQIKTVERGDLSRFRELRLRGLQEHPSAFGETAAGFEAQSLEQIAARVESQSKLGGFILGATAGSGEMVGCVGLALHEGEKMRHRGVLWGMYVAPEVRGQGIGRQLVQELLERAEQLDFLAQIHLSVVTSNTSAVCLYESMGFTVYGTDPQVLKVDDEAFDEYLMVRRLNRTGLT